MATVAAGQQTDGNRSLQGVTACRAIAEPNKRLACFDAATQALLADEREHRVVVLSEDDVARTRRSMFGFTIPDLKAFGAEQNKPSPPVLHLDSVVRQVRMVSYGKYDMQVEGGAVWRNTDLLDTAPSVGAKVRIDRTPFGGYILKLPFSASVHAQRIR